MDMKEFFGEKRCTARYSRTKGAHDFKVARLGGGGRPRLFREAVWTATLTAKGLDAGGFHSTGGVSLSLGAVQKISSGGGRTAFNRTENPCVECLIHSIPTNQIQDFSPLDAWCAAL
jgi:hypothetical protein